MKKFLLAVAALCAMSILPAFADHEWSKVDNSTIENDLWTLNASWNNGALTLNGATPKDGSLTTLDVSEMTIGGKLLNSINCWQNNNIRTVKKLIIPYEMNNFTTEVNAIPSLEEICTPDGGHELSIQGWGKSIVNKSNLAGDYVVKGVTKFGADSGGSGAFYECPNVTGAAFIGSFPVIKEKAVFLDTGIKSLAFETTATITEIPNYVCGYWGDRSQSEVPQPVQLTTLTLNGKPMLRCADITKVGSSVIPHAQLYAGIIDLPNCTSVGDYSFRDTGIPFVNLMSVSALGKYCFQECKDVSRVVFGAESFTSTIGTDILSGAFTQASDASVIWNCKTIPTFNGPCFRDVSKETKRITNYVRKEAGWLVENIASRPYVKNDGEEWCIYDWNNQTKRQPLVEMDTAFKVNLRLDGKVVMTTLMPGVSGENSVWTIPAGWFLEPGKTFGVGAVKDASGTAIDGASATPDGTGLNLTITLPASRVASVDGTTQDDEVFVDMVAQDNKDPQISVKVVDADNVTIVEESFEATVGTSVTKDYSADVFGENEFYFNNVLSLVVDPVDAAAATFGLDAKLSLVNIAKDAEIIVKIDRAARPTQLAYWNVDIGNYTMSDGVWTFRCDFTGGKAVIADAIGYNGADKDVAPVDFTKPIGTDGSSTYQVTTLDWGATINGSAIDTTKTVDHCGKDIVINGGTGTARTLVGVLKFPTTVKTITGWGYCENLTVDPALLATVSNFGKYALAYTSVGGALSFAEDNVVTIGDSAFEKSIKITSLNVPALNSTIRQKSFYHCTGLKTVELRGVTSIGWAAFSRDDGDHTTPGTYSMEKVVLSPALTLLNGSAFYKSTKSGCVFDAVSPKDMPAAKSGDGKISGNDFQDLGAGSIVIPFKGTCTIGAKVFHWSTTTNFIFWGKAPTVWIGNSDAVHNVLKDFNTQVKTDRRFTVSLAMDRAGWEGVATVLKKNCDAGDWAALNPPEKAFGYVMANTTRIWLCAGKSPWERGLIICFRGEDQD